MDNYPTMTERENILDFVDKNIENKDLEHPRDFRASDDWNQYRFENTGDECLFCGNSDVLHLHHTTVPPDLENVRRAISEEKYKDSGRVAKHIRRPEDRCKGCACLQCCHGCGEEDGLSPEAAVEKLSAPTIFSQSYEYSLIDDFEEFVNENVDDIVSDVVSVWDDYIQSYKLDSNTVTLCGRCHYLKHRYDVSNCKRCNNLTPPLSDMNTWDRRCGVCCNTHTQNEWQDVIENLLDGEYDGIGSGLRADSDDGEYSTHYIWKHSYDKIWQVMSNNSEYFSE